LLGESESARADHCSSFEVSEVQLLVVQLESTGWHILIEVRHFAGFLQQEYPSKRHAMDFIFFAMSLV
jgi:hypothetical protein